MSKEFENASECSLMNRTMMEEIHIIQIDPNNQLGWEMSQPEQWGRELATQGTY